MTNQKNNTSDSKQRVLKYLANHANRAFRPKELAKKLDLQGYTDYSRFRADLQELIETGGVVVLKGGRVMHRKPAARRVGKLSVNPRGFGFVAIEGEPEDSFVAGNNLGTALDGDIVEVGLAARARSSRKGPEVEVLSVVERTRTTAVGTFKQWGRFGVVVPDDKRLTHDIFVASESGAKAGDKVVVSIDKFDNPHGAPEGTIRSILGSSEDASTRVAAVAMSLGAPGDFPDDVVQAANDIPKDYGIDDGRIDYRNLTVFTIDPVDAKDFDDAISIETNEDDSIRLGVHIADVANYVDEGSPIDREAYARGTSIYLVDRVIPMLPERLSNELCSLRPDEDKRCITCFMDV
ncbi:MAG: RNB domain-containing ribonuclease, partial [Rhodothermales bacterium]|nr:RNB domain-containing ribonuclease [Rhodothermales bacterium]